MPKRDPTEDAFKRLAHLRTAPPTPESRVELADFLRSKTNLIVAKAADAIATLRLPDLAPDLESAFDRFLHESDDKGCAAKTAIANCLNRLGTGSERLFLLAVRHRQPEGSWGRPSDAAAELRATAALALASLGSREALPELADLLMDPETPCRIAAARALAHTSHDAASLPLRVKLLAGDPEIEVVEECLASLAKLAPKRAVPFIQRMLDSADDDETQSAAAFALALTREPAALQILLARFDRAVEPDARERLVAAIGLARLPEAVSFLLNLVESGSPTLAADALSALSSYRHDAKVHSNVEIAVKNRNDRALSAHFQTLFLTDKPLP